jgi:capsular exopolysaccharide synthesis family protein
MLRQRVVIGATIVICAMIALAYLLFATPLYATTARLQVHRSGPTLLPTANPRANDDGDPDNFLYTQKEILTSTPVLAIALGTPGVRDMKTFEGQTNLFAFVRKNLDVAIGKKDQLMSVSFDAPVREEGTRIVSALIDAYKDYQSTRRLSTVSDVHKILQVERDKRVAEVAQREKELQTYRQVNGLAGLTDKTDLTRQNLERLSVGVAAAIGETTDAKLAYEGVVHSFQNDPIRMQMLQEMEAAGNTVAPSAVDETTIRSQLLQLQAYALQLGRQYGPNHPAMQRVQGQIDQWNLTYAAALKRRWNAAQAREAELQKQFDAQQKVAIEQATKSAEEKRLMAEVQTASKSASDLDERIKAVALTEDGGVPDIQVLEPAVTEKSPSKPHGPRTLLIALVGGAVLGLFIGYLRDWYDYRFRSADEVRATLGVTVLGLIPQIGDESSPIARGQKMHIDPASEVSESYRSLRTAVYFGGSSARAHTILVTSPERGDGKTTVASNLAISMAQAGERVLLIDADLRAPMQDMIFQINGRIGLANVLNGKESFEAAVRRTGVEGLEILPAGVAARNPSEVLNSQRFIDLLEELTERYDRVIIDSPPLLAVTDARIISASADATVVVLRAGKTNRKLSEGALDGLGSVGAKVLGVVVNDVQRRGMQKYGYYGRYGYGNGATEERAALAAGDGIKEYAKAESEGSLRARDHVAS